MAGFYATFDSCDDERLETVAKFLRYGGESESSFVGPFSYVWLAHDRYDLFAPAIDQASGVRVIVAGRLCFPKSELQRAERMPYEGGLANRVVLEKYLSRGADGVVPYNGAAVVIVFDPRSLHVHLWTDQFGYHPSFVYGLNPDRPTAFTTFPDAIRCDAKANAVEDEVSMCEFVNSWRSTPPNTYYQHLKHAGAATHWTWELSSGKVQRNVYWKPFQAGFYKTLDEAGEALAASVSSAVRERTEMVSKSVFFVSGGSDSRVMLYAADNPIKLCGINIYEVEPTTESKISKSLCERIGVQYIGTGRDSDYYPRMLAENVRWSGAMWSAEDTHYLGMRDLVMEQHPELVMTACTTDWLFKGYGLEKTYKRLFGKNLPIKKFLVERIDGFLPNYPRRSPSTFAQQITERLAFWFAKCPRHLRADIDYLTVEDRRIRPACYTVSVSGQIMYRTFPYDTFLADSRVADCYGMTPAKWKLNGQVWGKAAGIICARANDIVDANSGWRVDATILAKLAGFARGWAGRRLHRKNNNSHSSTHAMHPPTYASWPDYGWYARNSQRLIDFWNATPVEHRERMTALWGSNPWEESLEQWSTHALDLFRIVTLLQKWRLKSGCAS